MGRYVQSVSGASGLTILGLTYVAAGPLPVGGVLRRVRVTWELSGNSVIAIAVVLVSADEETQANLKAGRSLVTRSLASIAGVPAVSFVGNPGAAGLFDLFWGIPLLASERYVLMTVSTSGTTGHGAACFSAEMLSGE